LAVAAATLAVAAATLAVAAVTLAVATATLAVAAASVLEFGNQVVFRQLQQLGHAAAVVLDGQGNRQDTAPARLHLHGEAVAVCGGGGKLMQSCLWTSLHDSL
jgi:hypothetical protein